MKLLLILAGLSLYALHTQAQFSQCRGRPSEQTCMGPANNGFGGWPNCRENSNREMWYYNGRSRSCHKLFYAGCGGNSNRFCSWKSCTRICR
ncbi:hypothetical protein KR222_009369, partial [Zaprionus bogoriensis]